MNVSQLIKQLRKMPPKAKVTIVIHEVAFVGIERVGVTRTQTTTVLPSGRVEFDADKAVVEATIFCRLPGGRNGA